MKTIFTLALVVFASMAFAQIDSSKVMDKHSLYSSLDFGANGSNHAANISLH
jgi:hypothetical protein